MILIVVLAIVRIAGWFIGRVRGFYEGLDESYEKGYDQGYKEAQMWQEHADFKFYGVPYFKRAEILDDAGDKACIALGEEGK